MSSPEIEPLPENEARRTISRVVIEKASGLLSDKLRAMILTGRVASGEMLPTERDLVVDTGLSRGSVREALKILETEGLIEIRTGRAGGARVTVPKRDSLARTFETFVRTNAVELSALLDCRLAAEPMLARLAARNRTDEELSALNELHRAFAHSAAVDDVPSYRATNFEWHLQIARASRNEPLTALMEAISTPVLEATGFARMTTPVTRHAAVHAHWAVMEAIESRDEAGASIAMEAHLSTFSRRINAMPAS